MFCIHQSQTTTELKRLSKGSNFLDFEKQLLIRFVCGVKYERLQHQLLAELELALDKAVKLSFEAANNNVETIIAAQNETKQICGCNNVCAQSCDYVNCKKENKSKANALENTDITCFGCGVVGHKAPGCLYINIICSKCHKLGHLKRLCRSANGGKAGDSEVYCTDESLARPGSKVNVEEHYKGLYGVNTARQTKPYRVHIQQNGKSHEFEVDSGAALTIVDHKVFERLWPNVNDQSKLTPCVVNFALWGGKRVHEHGHALVTLGYKGKHCVKDIVVANSAG
ncbi:hypothetical protein PR048_025976 [Dryococelus australis]|uniref:CCHC-type domain-containing protein n=1 Tax=Dryococelus australis TaxID=614101 RepID=A0ABQ9GK24_9NEOP|nr:hypothetical protein PR048_025976 [Dryococelus australis]